MKSSPGPCEVLAWDTEFWGFRVGRVRGHVLSEELMGGVDAWCRAEHVRCLYLLAAADHFESTRLAESSGFRLVDVRMTYARASEPGGPADGIRAAAPDVIPALREIARG